MRWLQEPDLPSAVISMGPSGGGFECAVTVTLAVAYYPLSQMRKLRLRGKMRCLGSDRSWEWI